MKIDEDDDFCTSDVSKEQSKGGGDVLLFLDESKGIEQEEEEKEKEESDYKRSLAAERKRAEDLDGARRDLEGRVVAWAKDSSGNTRNIRNLLSTLHTILWEGCKWKELSIGDLIEERKVKLAWRKAVVVVAPDKNLKEPPEVQYIARSVFEAINESFSTFNSDEK